MSITAENGFFANLGDTRSRCPIASRVSSGGVLQDAVAQEIEVGPAVLARLQIRSVHHLCSFSIDTRSQIPVCAGIDAKLFRLWRAAC